MNTGTTRADFHAEGKQPSEKLRLKRTHRLFAMPAAQSFKRRRGRPSNPGALCSWSDRKTSKTSTGVVDREEKERSLKGREASSGIDVSAPGRTVCVAKNVFRRSAFPAAIVTREESGENRSGRIDVLTFPWRTFM